MKTNTLFSAWRHFFSYFSYVFWWSWNDGKHRCTSHLLLGNKQHVYCMHLNLSARNVHCPKHGRQDDSWSWSNSHAHLLPWWGGVFSPGGLPHLGLSRQRSQTSCPCSFWLPSARVCSPNCADMSVYACMHVWRSAGPRMLPGPHKY